MAPALAQETLADRERAETAKRFVHQKLAVWQQRLHLEDWRISIVMARRNEMRPQTRGKIRWDKSKKSAVISVLDASCYGMALPEMLADMEFTIVHELIHLALASLPRSEASRRSEEEAVNRLTEALLGLDRQSRSAPTDMAVSAKAWRARDREPGFQ
jgi:hypothetical protein